MLDIHSGAAHRVRAVLTSVGLLLVLTGLAAAETLTHDTRSAFLPGTFDGTVLGGTEESPAIRLGTTTVFDWFFSDDDIDGWSYATNTAGNIAEENPAGQIHLAALYGGGDSGSWSYARREDVTLPDRFSIEFRVRFRSLDPSGVADPLATQPTGACARLDVLRPTDGFRVDVFSDRMAAFYREGATGADYPVISYIDIASETDRWYTLRFDIDFAAAGLPVHVHRDGVPVGELNGDARNGVGSHKLGPLAFSRGSASGLAEFDVDLVRVGSERETFAGTGTYTSAVLPVGATSLGPLTWSEVPTSSYPWSDWQKDPDNPVLAGPVLPENMLVDLDDPLMQPLLYDGRYWWVYSTGGPGMTIGLAYSTDPELRTWTPYEGNPVLTAGAGEDYVFSPNLFLHEGTYYLVYDAQVSADSHQRLYYATAPAPTGPWTRGQILLDLGAPGEWDDLRVTEPFVFKEGDTFFMYYMGDTGFNGNAEQIGLATTTADLFPLGPEPGGLWTKHGLVLPHDPDPSGWDTGLTADPSVIKVGDIYYMRYTGSYANEHWQLGTAWASDPYGPWHRPAAPDVLRGAAGTWDNDRLVRGAIHYHDGRFYGPYSGNGGTGWPGYQGGMVSADAAPLANELLLETRTSPDGGAWEEWRAVGAAGEIASTPDLYLQYRVTFLAQDGNTPELLGLALTYVDGVSAAGAPPPAVRLHRPRPNPFNPRAVIAFEQRASGHVRLDVFDVAGRRVARLADEFYGPGRHELVWTGTDDQGEAVASGVYFARLQTSRGDRIQRMTLVR